jgi:hypothetical protein
LRSRKRIIGYSGAVVADLVRTIRRRPERALAAGVEAGAAVAVVGLPGLVRGLEDDVGVARVVADDEDDVAGAEGVRPHQAGDVDAGDRGRRHLPGRRDGPVAAVDQTGRRVGQAVRLDLRQREALRERGLQAGAVAAVPAEPVDVDPVGDGVRLDLEVDGGALVDRDLGREALDRRVAGAVDVPGVQRRAGPFVLGSQRDRAACPVRGDADQDGEHGRGQHDGQETAQTTHRHHARSGPSANRRPFGQKSRPAT